jgi:hypothetical protein
LPQTPVTVRYRLAGREDEIYSWEGYLARYDGVGLDTASRTVPVRIIVDQPSRFTHMDRSGRNHEVRGPTALVRGMFVEVVLHTRPQAKLSLVPRAALRPGNRIWRFRADESALGAGEVRTAAKATGASVAASTATASTETFDESAWEPGWIEVIRDVRPLTEIRVPRPDGRGESEYWVVELLEGELSAGDRLITSPLEGLKEDGTDGVRVARASASPVAETNAAAVESGAAAGVPGKTPPATAHQEG